MVQSHASALYLIRAPRTEQAQELFQRVNLIARGMAMATETNVSWELIKTCAELIPNIPLEQELAALQQQIDALNRQAESLFNNLSRVAGTAEYKERIARGNQGN